MSQGSLYNWIFTHREKSIEISVINKLLLEISLAMHYLHSQVPKIIHRDLKSLNILVLLL